MEFTVCCSVEAWRPSLHALHVCALNIHSLFPTLSFHSILFHALFFTPSFHSPSSFLPLRGELKLQRFQDNQNTIAAKLSKYKQPWQEVKVRGRGRQGKDKPHKFIWGGVDGG